MRGRVTKATEAPSRDHSTCQREEKEDGRASSLLPESVCLGVSALRIQGGHPSAPTQIHPVFCPEQLRGPESFSDWPKDTALVGKAGT